MAIQVSAIKVGDCYETANNQHRRVLKHTNGEVTYESWGGNVGNSSGHLNRNSVNENKFANDVTQGIACPANLRPLQVVLDEMNGASKQDEDEDE